jgi:hypothetical protein
LIIKKPRYEIAGVAKRKNINLNTVFYSYFDFPHSPGFPTGFAGKVTYPWCHCSRFWENKKDFALKILYVSQKTAPIFDKKSKICI